MTLRVDGKAIPKDRHGRYHVASFVRSFYDTPSAALLASVSRSVAGAEYVDDVEGLVAALVAAKKTRNGKRFWKRITYDAEGLVPKDKEEMDDVDIDDDDDDIYDDEGPQSSDGESSAIPPAHPPAHPPAVAVAADDINALASALLAIQGHPECEAAIRPLLMRAVELRGSALGLHPKASDRVKFTVSQRAEHLGFSLADSGVSAAAVGKRALELYREQYARTPGQRWATLSNGNGAYIYCYTEDEALLTLDVALRELTSTKKRRK